MKAVIVSDHFSSPEEPGILRTWQVARYLAGKGDDVVVIAPARHYLYGRARGSPPTAIWALPDRLRVVRMRVAPLRRGSALSRLRYYAEQVVLSAAQTWRAGPCDVVVAGLTPSMLGIGAYLAARVRRWHEAQRPYVDASHHLADLLQLQFAQTFPGSPLTPSAVPLRDLRSVAEPAVAIEIANVSAPSANLLLALAGPLSLDIERAVETFQQSGAARVP